MRLSRNRVEISRCTFCSGAVDIENCDAGAFRHEPPGGRKTYPSRRGRTRNNSCFAAEQHAFLPWVCFLRHHCLAPALLGKLITPWATLRQTRSCLVWMNLVHLSNVTLQCSDLGDPCLRGGRAHRLVS